MNDKGYIYLLQNINVSVTPGKMLVIMGPSGSGKTTLLNALAGRLRLTSDRVEGNILYNGQAKTTDLKKFSNYVMQRDQLFEFLTVRETLMISAALKMKSATHEQKVERVNQVLVEVGLWKNQHTHVGGAFKKGLSGGEIKRLSIAIELLDNPSILFLDEPTSGLDASLAYNVLQLLIGLAKNSGRTIICTVHQPRSQVFSKFDMLLLLYKGRIVYQGRSKDVGSYFGNLGYSCPPQFNLADFILDLITPAKDKKDANKKLTEEEKKEVEMVRRKSSNLGPPIHMLEEGKIDQIDSNEGTTSAVPPQNNGNDFSPEENKKAKRSSFFSPPKDISFNVGEGEEGDDRVLLSAEEIEIFPEHYLKSDMHKNVMQQISSKDKLNKMYSKEMLNLTIDGFVKEHQAAWYDWFVQVYYLTYRSSLNSWRNPTVAFAQFAINIFIALILGGLFWQLPSEGLNMTSARNVLGCLFFQTCNLAFSSMSSLITFPAQRTIFNRETANYLYYPSAFFVAQSIADAPFQLLPRMIYMCIVYFMCGLEAEAGHFFYYFLTGILVVFAACSYMYCIGAAFSSLEMGQLIAPILMVIFMLLGGFYLNDNSIPAWIGWFRYFSFLRWSYFAFAANQFRPGEMWGDIPNSVILEMGGVSDTRVWFNLVILAVLGVAYRVLAFIGLKYSNRRVGLEA